MVAFKEQEGSLNAHLHFQIPKLNLQMKTLNSFCILETLFLIGFLFVKENYCLRK